MVVEHDADMKNGKSSTMRPVYRPSSVKKAYVREHREGTSLPTQEEETERAREDFLEEVSAFGLGLK